MNNKDKLLHILMDINPDIDFETETALVDGGMFDSLEIMSLVTDICDYFHVDINPDDVIPENFNSLDAILATIEKNR